MHKLATILLLPLALATILPARAATVPGAIPGSFGVSETGAATYSISIAVPPGTAGMEPKLSLNYSSQSGNGIAGVGWSLGGLSAITRCPKTIIHDGATRGVQLDAEDRFCLDGQRLILIPGSAYGAVNAEYRAEIESFTRVVSYGGTLGDPQYFKVWTKAGQIIEFGTTDSSRVEAQGKLLAVAWAVNKIRDTVGNYIDLTYFEDNVSGEHRITRIDYTGSATVTPYNAVEFQYESRPDVDISYVQGSKSQASQRLAKVLTYDGSNVVRDYSLAYETGETTGKSRLISVTECAANGDCLNPTTFDWQEGEASLDAIGVNTGIPNANALHTHGFDVDGDGITDVVYPSGTSWKVRFGGVDGFSPEVDTDIANTGYQYARPLDYNADGKGDLLVPYSNNTWHVLVSTGHQVAPFSAPQNMAIPFQPLSASSSYQILDANGDGLSDVVAGNNAISANYWRLYLGDGIGFIGQFDSYYRTGGDYLSQVGDWNGDGLQDVFVPHNYLCGAACNFWDVAQSAVSGFQPRYTSKLVTVRNNVTFDPADSPFVDVNGDGLSDLTLALRDTGTSPAYWRLCLNSGVQLTQIAQVNPNDFLTSCVNTGFTASGLQRLRALDYNADGLPDYLIAPYANGRFYVFQSKRAGFDLIDSGIPDTGYDQNPFVGDFNGDGLMDLMLSRSGAWHLHTHKGAVPDRLLNITDGFGATRAITYRPLTDPDGYAKGSGSAYPVQDVQGAMYVVSETAVDDGSGGKFRVAYRYAGARTHLTGHGFLGFATLEQTDLQTGIVTRTDYSQTFPKIGMPLLTTRVSSGGVELSRVENTLASKSLNTGKTFFPYIAYSKAQGWDLNGALLPSTETWNTFDDWGNLTRVITQTSDGFKKQTDNTYTNDDTQWFLGRLTGASVASTADGVTQTRVSAFEYDAATGLLNKEIIEPDAPNIQYRLDTGYTFDAFGNRTETTVSSPATGSAAIVSRKTTTTYDARGQFPVTLANALGHSESKTFDPGFGGIKELTGPNNLTTSWQYDGFGRKTRETRADGTFTRWAYDFCDDACPASGAYRIVTQTYGGSIQTAPVSVAYFDRLNREVRTATQGFDGSWIYKDTEYDNRGNVSRVSRPYFANQTAYWATSEYDDLGRLVKAFEPDVPATPTLTVIYNGLTTSRTNRKNQTTVEVRDSQGQKMSVTDAMGQVTTYAYDPFGNLARTTDPAGNQIINLYDIRGRKTQTIDPDLGSWLYEYNTLGELVKQTDAKAQVTNFQYDTLGRMVQRIEPGLTSDWVWDTSPTRGKGKLFEAKTSASYSRTHYYDDIGRPVYTFTSADGQFLLEVTLHDSSGRLVSQFYPSGFGVKYVYNNYGYLTEVRNSHSNALYWQLNARDAEGHVTRETYGNGIVTDRTYVANNGRLFSSQDAAPGNQWIQYHYYSYDTLGNVEGHWNSGAGEWNTLIHDSLNRLTQIDRYLAGVPSTEAVAYDALGNIQNKTGVGTYYYGGNANCVNSNVGPHAVCSAGSNSYGYDANGNLTGGAGRSITWTAWNMPASITQGGQDTLWLYGPEHDRYKMVTPGRTTWYLNPSVHQGAHYERTQYASGTTEHRHTLYGGGQPIGEVLTFIDGSPSQTRYFHSDGQGSISAVTDSTGAVITRYRYDPWGKQTLVSGSNTSIAQTRQGHTGHEMLDGGLTHMNGRLYDPVLARFVSADPIVQAPYNLQSLNRYSYVLNNPLYYTDPTGFSAWTDFRDGFLKPVLSIAASVYLPGSSLFTGMGLTGTSGIIAAGAVSGAITGGGRGALAGAVSAGMFSQLHGMSPGIGKIAAHGVAGGMMSEMQGGSFKSGFLAAGFTQGASQFGLFNNLGDPGTWSGRAANAIGAAVVGGTASVIGGGKFANGAMTGAFSRLFNDLKCYQTNTCAGKVMNTKASCGNDCVLHDAGTGGKIWVKPALLSSLASVKSGNLNSIDDLTTTPAEARKIAQGSLLAVGLVAAPLGSPALAGVALWGGAGLTFADPNASFDDYASTAVSFATRGLGNYGAGTWVENFANGVESYNTIWQVGDFAKKNQ